MTSKQPRHKVISCAECRRLKLKCDRKFPCHNCVKRGLTVICPDGSLPTRPKVLMEEAERLTQVNTELTDKLRLLEEALEAVHKKLGKEPHPLLVKREPGSGIDTVMKIGHKSIEDVNDSLGTLTIDPDGRSIFLGTTAGMESIFRAQEAIPKDQQTVPVPNLLPTIGIFSNLRDAKDGVLAQVQYYLPPTNVAHILIDVYFEHGAWMYTPITRDQFFDQVFDKVYSASTGECFVSNVNSHDIAILFMVFALGAFLSPESDDDAGEDYHQLARMTLSCDPILVNPTVPSIRALILMAHYHMLRDQNAAQHAWALIGLSAHMAHNIGLHRDGRQWKMENSIVQERRTLFWEIYYMCMNLAISFGRPPSFSLDYCDCEYPRTEDRLQHRAGEFKPSFAARKYQFAAECLSHVAKATLAVQNVAYSTILALDHRIREHVALKIPGNGATGPMELGAATIPLTFQRFMLKAHCEMTLLYLHRRYFARAVVNYSKDILHCQYGPSVVAIFRSASVYIALMRDLCSLMSGCHRYVLFWNNLLASSFIMGSIATRCPTSVLAQSALSELDVCYSLFENAAQLGGKMSRPARALNIVSNIREKAHQIAMDIQAGVLPKKNSRRDESKEDELDEITFLSGRARVVSVKSSDSSSSPQSARSTPPVPSLEPYKTAHPELLRHLREAVKTPLPMSSANWGPLTLEPMRHGSALMYQDLDPSMNAGGDLPGPGENEGMLMMTPWDDASPSLGLGNCAMDWGAYMKQFGMQIDPDTPPS